MIDKVTKIYVTMICILAAFPLGVVIHELTHWIESSLAEDSHPVELCFNLNPDMDSSFGHVIAWTTGGYYLSEALAYYTGGFVSMFFILTYYKHLLKWYGMMKDE